ncbi:aldehyde oxidase and xanthine dehydrogenase molybdopterin binding protein [Burkholderia sp. YI23]|uniref:xanthine dehydrogenase family protein molybdopterin-binding subunit n=1 Tax=unclassified Caballeronia TaxID=2646786 RepID=UPI00023886DB|nr:MULTISPECIES: molybdopterin cofactor-binding domain-containing protein [unclassified Caballeronia]AET89487.1 aldehyde oxidase and xanthine dehydrogenase molybdopterin binding protein [Burkholderia sp. YI23]MCE4541463.1 molybdopterin-dependent oxidoreductase [Caballeronia sp. PC1]MCE4569493.1 molybdopterin-dependent oxidoreductase [Caballeronia sp. CLC5]
MGKPGLSRRGFLKASVLAGVSVFVAPLGSRAFAALFEEKILTPVQWDAKNGDARFRIDGIAKVTGAKVFARDIRASDMPHWPKEQAHALILRTTLADRLYEGIDLSLLDAAGLAPDRVVTADVLARDQLAFPAFYGDDMLLPAGKTPAYLGQAVAILIFHDFARFRFAKEKLQFRDGVIRYGATTGPLERDPWAAFRFVRVGGTTPYDDDTFSSLKDTSLFPHMMKKREPVWADAAEHGKLDEQGMFHAQHIADALDHPPEDWLVVDRHYRTQSVDTAALEPDNANCWYDAATQSLHMVIPTQGPTEVTQSVIEMTSKSHFAVKKLFLHPCYTVGYGSKDHYNMPFYGLVAAMYGDGRPVRLANDRFEQFQSSLKRHAFDMRYRMAIDKKTGLIQAFKGDFAANGGGRCNFSPSVAMVGATAAQSIYNIPKSDLTAVATASRAVDAGSARGYGTLQSMAATEMMIDDIAEQLGIDPIELRVKNVFRTGMKNTQGAIPAGVLRAEEVLKKAQVHPLWTDRVKRKTDFEATHPGKRYGVGFSCVQKDFGTGAESAFAKVEFTADGRISLFHSGAEIGTGSSTAQALAVAKWLGKPAVDVHMAVTDWSDLPVVSSGDPYIMSQAEQDRLSANPRWSPTYASPASATNSAYYYTHATREAARAVFRQGLWPAAMALWGQGIGGGQAASFVVRIEDARWVDGALSAGGMAPLPFEQLAKKAHELGLATGAAVHTFNRWQWSEALFDIAGNTERLPIDGLSLRSGAVKHGALTPNGYAVLDRKKVFIAPVSRNNAAVTYYSAMGTLVELAIDEGSGKVDLLAHHSIFECGNQLSPALVSGQVQGGIAMGIGHALHEYLPLYEDGPGNGTWNFNRYHLPLASDVAVWKQTSEVLPPLTETDPPKGIAEVVMIPVVGAIVNAIAHAIGHRFTDLPVTSQNIQEVLA